MAQLLEVLPAFARGPTSPAPTFSKEAGMQCALQPQCLVEMGCAQTDRCPGLTESLACQWALGLVRALVPSPKN